MFLVRHVKDLDIFPRENMVFYRSSMPIGYPWNQHFLSGFWVLLKSYLEILITQKQPFLQKRSIWFSNNDAIHQSTFFLIRHRATQPTQWIHTSGDYLRIVQVYSPIPKYYVRKSKIVAELKFFLVDNFHNNVRNVAWNWSFLARKRRILVVFKYEIGLIFNEIDWPSNFRTSIYISPVWLI